VSSIFSNDTLAVPCPACRHTMRLPVAALEQDFRYVCEQCGSDLEIDADGLVDALRDVDRAIDELERSVARLAKRL
jgi:transposase-like protein